MKVGGKEGSSERGERELEVYLCKGLSLFSFISFDIFLLLLVFLTWNSSSSYSAYEKGGKRAKEGKGVMNVDPPVGNDGRKGAYLISHKTE